MKRRRLLASGLLAAALAGAGPARAEHGLIKDLDKDGDKKLSWSEVEPIGWSKLMFELKDMDADGKVSEKDLLDHVEWLKTPAVNAKIIAAMDTDGDGAVAKEGDFWWWGEEDFARYDLDKDNRLDKDELAKLPKAKPWKAAKPGKKAPKPKSKPKEAAQPAK